MRLIDADAINFEEIFGGQSDFAKDTRAAAQGLIDRQPTAFDKENVLDELKGEIELVAQTHGAAWQRLRRICRVTTAGWRRRSRTGMRHSGLYIKHIRITA